MREFLSTIWKTLFFNPFLNILLILYAVLGNNLGLAVILIALIVRIILLPSTKRQMAMTKKMSDMRPKLAELQKKYKNDREKLGQAQMKLYKEAGYNPLGCLGSYLPQFIILFAIFGVIRTLSDGDFSGVYEPVANFVGADGFKQLSEQVFLWWDLSLSWASFSELGFFSAERFPYLMLAVAVGISQFLSTAFMQKFQGLNQPAPTGGSDPDNPMSSEEMQANMTKSMLFIFPLMTAYFTLNQPSILGVYWFAQAIFLVGQYFVIDRKRSAQVINDLIPGRKSSLDEKEKKNDNQKVKEIEATKVDDVQTIPLTEEETAKKEKKKKKRKKRKKRKR